ncbi:hypothetical protein PTKIN_Ptkin06aG0178800 [Pterospermum kingtungense]
MDAEQWSKDYAATNSGGRNPPQRVVPAWCSPNQGCLKLNVDVGYSAANKTTQGGFVVRDSSGAIHLSCASLFHSVLSVLQAELLSTLFGLEAASSARLKLESVECDSTTDIAEIHKGSTLV